MASVTWGMISLTCLATSTAFAPGCFRTAKTIVR